MRLADLIRPREARDSASVFGPVATVTLATLATLQAEKARTVATVATVAVAKPQNIASSGSGAAEPTSRACRDCAHRTRHGTCGAPTEAGLSQHFAIRWPPEGYAARCPAFTARQRPEPKSALREYIPATDRELERMLTRWQQARAAGLSEAEADHLADRLHTRDREGLDMHACAECRHLRAQFGGGWACRMWRAAGLGGEALLREFVVGLHRCPAFGGHEHE